jgi:copper(I)-binding protein
MRAGPYWIATALALTGCDREPRLEVSGYARPTVEGQSGSAAYLRLENKGGGEDRLVSVSSPVVQSISLHESRIEGGVARMRGAQPPTIEGGGTLAMAPGGLHLMLMGLRSPLHPGERLPLTLSFERSGSLQTAIPIQMDAPDGHRSDH